MSIINYDILQVAGFEQGTIGSMYDAESTSRVRSIGYMQMNPTTYNAILEATATTDKQVQIAFRGYSGTTPESLICNLYWYDSPKSFDLNSYQNLRYFRVVLKYSDNSDITPSEIATATSSMTTLPIWGVEDNRLVHDELPEPITGTLMQDPYPPFWWYVEDGDERLQNRFLAEPSAQGAFYDCTQLKKVEIPETVKYIGEYAFANTALTTVKIARDCTFFPTSFPPRCIIQYYDT